MNDTAQHETIEMVQFLLNMPSGLRHQVKMRSVVLSESRGEYVTMTQVITEAIENYLREPAEVK